MNLRQNPIAPGTAVYARGALPSALPWDGTALFSWDEGGETLTQTNAFTVASLRLIPDLNGDTYMGADEYDLFDTDAPDAWRFPVREGLLRQVFLQTDVALEGIFTLTLGGSNGTFRVWEAGTTNGTPADFAANGAVWGEALKPGAATLTYRFTGTNAAEGLTLSCALPLTAYAVETKPITSEKTLTGKLFNPYVLRLNGKSQ